MAAKRYMVDLPDPSRPGEYYSEGPLTRSEVLDYLGQWYPNSADGPAFALFVTELNQGDDGEDEDEDEDEDEEAGEDGHTAPPVAASPPPTPDPGAPRYTHDCSMCTFEGRYGRYDAYFCRAGDDEYATALLRYGHEVSQYKSRPRFLHKKDPAGFPEAALYTAVFAKHPGQGGAR